MKARYADRRRAVSRPHRLRTALIVAGLVGAGALALWRLGGGSANRAGAPAADQVAAVASTSFPTTDGTVSLAEELGSKLVVFFYDGAT